MQWRIRKHSSTAPYDRLCNLTINWNSICISYRVRVELHRMPPWIGPLTTESTTDNGSNRFLLFHFNLVRAAAASLAGVKLVQTTNPNCNVISDSIDVRISHGYLFSMYIVCHRRCTTKSETSVGRLINSANISFPSPARSDFVRCARQQKNSLLKYSLFRCWWLRTAFVCYGQKQWKVCDLSLLRSIDGSHSSSSSEKSTFARVIYWNGIAFTRVGGWRLQPLSRHCSPSSRQTHNSDMLTFQLVCECSTVCSVANSFAPFVIIVALLHAMNVLAKVSRISSCMFEAMFAQIDVCIQKTWKITRNAFFMAQGTTSAVDNDTEQNKTKRDVEFNKIFFFTTQDTTYIVNTHQRDNTVNSALWSPPHERNVRTSWWNDKNEKRRKTLHILYRCEFCGTFSK